MISVAVGDPHVVPGEIDDATALFDLVCKTVREYGAEAVVILGDLHNAHDSVSVRVGDFWHRTLARLPCERKILIVGNHDQAFTDRTHPHALRAYATMPGVEVVDSPRGDVLPGVAAMPYYRDPARFVDDAAAVAAASHNPYLICHQTFDGARYENGFYAKDGVSPKDVDFFRQIYSGHIHTPHAFANVRYLGAPRWRTASDANTDRFIYVLRHTGDGLDVVAEVPTGPVCRRVWRFEDRAETPWANAEGARPSDDAAVSVFGPADRVKTRCAEIRAAGFRALPHPDREVSAAESVSEHHGVAESLRRYAVSWAPPRGSDRDAVLKEVEARAAA